MTSEATPPPNAPPNNYRTNYECRCMHLFRFGLRLLAGSQRGERDNGWDDEKLFHGDWLDLLLNRLFNASDSAKALGFELMPV